MMRIKWSGGTVERGSVEPNSVQSTGAEAAGVDLVTLETAGAVPEPAADQRRAEPAATVAPSGPLGHEEVARIHVEPEDRLAFRVGVNILTLALVGLTVYLVWRRYFAGG